MENNKNKVFLSAMTGENTKGSYIFHMEGNVARAPMYREKTSDKEAFIALTVGVGRNAWECISQEAAKSHPENKFVNLVAFGDLATAIHDAVEVGSKIVFCGRPSVESYQRKDGTPGESVKCIVDGFAALSCRATKGSKPGRNVPHTTRVYKTRDGKEGKENLAMLLTGKVKRCDAVRENDGRQSISFDLELELAATAMAAIVAGNWSKDASYGDYKTVRCTVWGPRASRLTNVLSVGNELAVTGSPSVRTYNDKEYVNLSVREVSVMNWATTKPAASASATEQKAEQKAEQEPAGVPESSGPNYGFLEDGGDEDDRFELPF